MCKVAELTLFFFLSVCALFLFLLLWNALTPYVCVLGFITSLLSATDD